MRPEQLTIKAQEAVGSAQNLAIDHGHQELQPEHILMALLKQDGGVAGPLLERAGVSPAGLQTQVATALGRFPSVSGGGEEIRLPTVTRKTLEAAEKSAKELKDDYVSVEHLLLGIMRAGGSAASGKRHC